MLRNFGKTADAASMTSSRVLAVDADTSPTDSEDGEDVKDGNRRSWRMRFVCSKDLYFSSVMKALGRTAPAIRSTRPLTPLNSSSFSMNSISGCRARMRGACARKYS